MLGSLKKTVKHTALYGLGNISTKLVGLILLPLYTSNLTTSDYGILSIIEITSQIFIGLFTFSLPHAMIRWCATESDEANEKSIIFSTLVGVIVLGSVLIGSLIPFHNELSELIFGNNNYSIYFLLLLIWSYLGIINKFPASLLRLREKALFFSIVMIVKFIIILAANIYFVAFAKMGVEGIVVSQIIGEVCGLVIVLPFIGKNLKLKLNFLVIKEMAAYGFPLAFSSVSSLLLASGDRYVITYYLSFASVGIYSLAQKIGSVINVFLIHSFQQGFLPLAFKMFIDERPNRFFQKTLTYFTFVLSITALVLSLFSEEIIKLFTEKAYFSAYLYVPFIAFAFIIKGINFVFTLGFHHAKKTSMYALIIISGMILTILLNILLIPLLDLYGSILAMLISYSLMAFATYKSAQKLYYINYEIGKILLLLSLAAFLCIIGYLLPITNPIQLIMAKLVLIISFPILLKFFKFYEEIELLRIRQSWKKWRNPLRWKENISKIKL